MQFALYVVPFGLIYKYIRLALYYDNRSFFLKYLFGYGEWTSFVQDFTSALFKTNRNYLEKKIVKFNK
jgi:hypothetical protein